MHVLAAKGSMTVHTPTTCFCPDFSLFCCEKNHKCIIADCEIVHAEARSNVISHVTM